MQPEQQQRIMGYFIEEAKDHLNTIEQGLLNLQSTLEDSEMVNELFRAAHSVKGGAAMLGLNSIQRVSHRLEDFFKTLKESRVQVDQKLESLFLRIFDALQELIEQLQGPFGLTDDAANTTVAAVEPVFVELEKHLNGLVEASGGAQPEISFPTTDFLIDEPVFAPEGTLAQVFGSDVSIQLREMLQLFKQSETDSRTELQQICRNLIGLGEQFNLPAWCGLLEAARQAIAHPNNLYRMLAPIVIRDIKQAQDLVLAGRSDEIMTGFQLLALVPAQPAPAQPEAALREPDLDEMLEMADTPLAADPLFTNESTGDDLFADLSPTIGATSNSSEASLNLGNPFADLTDEHQGPEVGMAELNSLADLFEGEVPDLGSTWQEEEILQDGTDLLATSTANSDSDDSAADFADLLFDDGDSRQPSQPETDDLNDLFGDDLLEEDIAAAALDSGSTFESGSDDLDDLLAIADSGTTPVDTPPFTSEFEVVDPFAGLDLGLDTAFDRLEVENLEPAMRAEAEPLDDLGDLFSGMDETDLGLATSLPDPGTEASPWDTSDDSNLFGTTPLAAMSEQPGAETGVGAIADPWEDLNQSLPVIETSSGLDLSGDLSLAEELFGSDPVSPETASEADSDWDMDDLFGSDRSGDTASEETEAIAELSEADLGDFSSLLEPDLPNPQPSIEELSLEGLSGDDNLDLSDDLWSGTPDPSTEMEADLFGTPSEFSLTDPGEMEADLFGTPSEFSLTETGVEPVSDFSEFSLTDPGEMEADLFGTPSEFSLTETGAELTSDFSEFSLTGAEADLAAEPSEFSFADLDSESTPNLPGSSPADADLELLVESSETDSLIEEILSPPADEDFSLDFGDLDLSDSAPTGEMTDRFDLDLGTTGELSIASDSRADLSLDMEGFDFGSSELDGETIDPTPGTSTDLNLDMPDLGQSDPATSASELNFDALGFSDPPTDEFDFGETAASGSDDLFEELPPVIDFEFAAVEPEPGELLEVEGDLELGLVESENPTADLDDWLQPESEPTETLGADLADPFAEDLASIMGIEITETTATGVEELNFGDSEDEEMTIDLEADLSTDRLEFGQLETDLTPVEPDQTTSEFANLGDLDLSPAADMGNNFADLDDFMTMEAATESNDFADLDDFLGQETPPTVEFADLNNLILEETETSNGFADLDNLLNDNESALTADNSFGFLNGDSLEVGTASSGGSFDDDFADLEALLGEDVSVDRPIEAPVAGKSEFDELDDLLKDAEEKMGGPPSVPVSRGITTQNRRPTRPGRVFSEQTMRVPVKHLDNLSNLVGELVVNRNSLEQDQERLRQSLDNLLYQVQQLSDVGQRMQDLYERSLLESSLLASRQGYRQGGSSHSHSSGVESATMTSSSGIEYDPLEMDRFTGFHSLSQEMIELIVRVRESASDIEFIVDETDQVTRMFRQVTTQLQEGLTRSRMVPFAQTADRLPRAVRDIAMKVGKQAELVIEGRETLIDKMILEQLYDPMTHLVNNAITHGIESPDVRRSLGKPATGRINIRAFHQGNQTIISVSDDGAGIDIERVKAKAIEKRLVTPAEARTMSRMDIYDLLFHPGFSTKDQADDFSGRGVGMDVVRTSLSEIRGAINTDSNQGKGTTFTIRLPLTLSISKALCCISDRARIAFPMDGVEDMLDVPKERIQTNAEGQPCLPWRDSLLPLHPLNDLLSYNRHLSRGNVYGGNQEDDICSIVVLRSAGNFLALQVDQVLGEQEIVIKQLEGPVPKPVGVAGATVLGDGRIMPIADVLELIDLAMGRIRKDSGGTLWDQGAGATPQEPAVTKTEPMVLIVDDSITVRELLSMTFNKVGYRVEQARDGQEAWEKLRSGLPCDIVFCDIEMPRMDGLELLSRIQKDPNLTHLPIAMLTSRGADRHRQMASTLGASGYFTKPYLEEALLDAAQRMLKGEKLL